MPSWLLNFVLPYVAPALITALSPIIVEYLKKAADFVNLKMPASALVVLAAAVTSLVAAAQSALTGVAFPPFLQPFVPLIGIFLNELGKDFGKQPPTPGVK
jgi:hypothetical protein